MGCHSAGAGGPAPLPREGGRRRSWPPCCGAAARHRRRWQRAPRAAAWWHKSPPAGRGISSIVRNSQPSPTFPKMRSAATSTSGRVNVPSPSISAAQLSRPAAWSAKEASRRVMTSEVSRPPMAKVTLKGATAHSSAAPSPIGVTDRPSLPVSLLPIHSTSATPTTSRSALSTQARWGRSSV